MPVGRQWTDAGLAHSRWMGSPGFNCCTVGAHSVAFTRGKEGINIIIPTTVVIFTTITLITTTTTTIITVTIVMAPGQFTELFLWVQARDLCITCLSCSNHPTVLQLC